VTASAGDGQATITFSPPAANGGATITRYTVVSSPGGFTATGSGSPITVSGLANGTAYTFSVTATNLAGTGPASSASNSVTPQAGSLPLTLVVQSTFPVGVVGTDYPLQILTATGGVKPYTFSVSSGSLPPGLGFASPQFSGIPASSGMFTFTITVTDSAGAASSAPGSILINPANADLILSQSTVDFGLTSGSQGVPMPASVTVRSSVIQQLLNYAVTVSPPAPWLDVLGGGTTPGSIAIALDPSALTLGPAAAPYQTTITATCVAPSPCAGSTKTVIVSLNVSAPDPQIALTSAVLSFDAVSSDPVPVSQLVGIQNSGGGTLVIESSSTADTWISVANLPATLAAGPPVSFTVTVNSGGLSPGYYTSSLTIWSSAGSITLPVNLRVAPKTTMQLASSGSQFQTTLGTALGNPNGSLLVTVDGDYTVNFTASVIGGSGWLSLNNTQGSATASQPGTVGFSVDPFAASVYGAQAYYGAIRITSPDVVNSPLDFEVVLNVLPAGTPVKPEPSPAGLVFAPAPGVLTASGTVQVYASSANALPYQASAATQDGAGWLSVTPATGVASAASAAQSTVSVNTAGLAAGVYRGGISYAFSSAAVRTVNITLVVGTPGMASPSGALLAAQAACSPSKLIVTQTGLVHNFQQPAGWPVGVAVKLITDCGTPLTDAQVVASFSNGDPPIALNTVDNTSGVFAGTWTPGTVSPQVTINATASGPNSLVASAEITGQVTANAPPMITPNAVLHIFRPVVGSPLAPGLVIQIYGSNLAVAPQSATGTPLPYTLGGTSVLIGGVPAPLFYVSPGQIDAQVPFELAPGNEYQVRVTVNGALSAAESIALVSVAPGIAATDSGAAIAQHLDFTLVSDSAPLEPGEYVILYLAGMGVTDTPVASGAASPAIPLVDPSDPPIVTLNGNPVDIAFDGLTPGSVGLYQINLQIPSDLADGTATIVVTQSGFASNAVTLPIKR
jgi:uncharacterized protein (TIGR03437 family)